MLGMEALLAKSHHERFQTPRWSEADPDWQQLERSIPVDDRARGLVARLDALDLTTVFRSYVGCGSKPLRPDLMLRIVAIEVERGHVTPAEWHRNCSDSQLLLWAGLGIKPSRASWYNFAYRLGPLLPQLLRQTLTQAVAEQVTSATEGSLDGTYFAANASRHHLANADLVDKRLALLEQARAQDVRLEQGVPDTDLKPCAQDAGLAQACVPDTSGGEAGARPAWMAKNPTTRGQQLRRYEHCRARLKELQAVNLRQRGTHRRPAHKIVISPTDPEAIVGRDKLKVYRPLYNAQVVRDLRSPLILGYDVRATNHDGGAIKTMVERLPQTFGITLDKLAVDAAYVTSCSLALCDEKHLDLYGPLIESHEIRTNGKPRQGKRATHLPKSQFEWLPEQNAYRCPEGFLLLHIGKETCTQVDGETNIVHKYRCRPLHCRECPRATACTTNPQRGRAIRRQQHEELLERHRQKMATDEAKQFYRQRHQTIETTFGDVKQNRSLRELSFRGLARAATQIGLLALVNNVVCLAKNFLRRQTVDVSPCLPSPAS